MVLSVIITPCSFINLLMLPFLFTRVDNRTKYFPKCCDILRFTIYNVLVILLYTLCINWWMYFIFRYIADSRWSYFLFVKSQFGLFAFFRPAVNHFLPFALFRDNLTSGKAWLNAKSYIFMNSTWAKFASWHLGIISQFDCDNWVLNLNIFFSV